MTFQAGLFDGKVAFISGGGTGIGAGIARGLGRLGARVAIASRKPEHIEPAAAGLTAELGHEVLGLTMDLRDRNATARAVDATLARFGRIDVLVNNGGGQFLSPAAAIRPNGFDAVIQTNLVGTWNLTRAVADATMLQHGGAILNITMLTNVFPGMAHSVAARAGVEAMTRTLAVEWAAAGIRLNCLAPGYVNSSGLRNYPPDSGLIESMVSRVPLKRLATVAEIADFATFLLSPAATYCTGQTYVVDGGKSLWGDTWPIPDPGELTRPPIPREPWES